MLPRFFAPEADPGATNGVVALPEDEAVHLARVLRLAPGAAVRVFDGRGQEWSAEVTEVGRQRVILRVIEAVAPARESKISITLVVSVLKGEKMDHVVRDAVMLGTMVIQPVVAERSEISLAALERSNRLDRWRRIAVASAKQCGRAVVPPVDATITLEQLFARASNAARLMLVEPGADPDHTLSLRDVARTPVVELLIGPEGGWARPEIAMARMSGASPVTLGGPTLRADAVPMVALTALRTLWDDL